MGTMVTVNFYKKKTDNRVFIIGVEPGLQRRKTEFLDKDENK